MGLTDGSFLILLTNDDGIEARGLKVLQESLRSLGRVVTVAPSEERSASGHGLTIHHPIRITPLREDYYSVSGTPVDCVIFAFRKILSRLPDLVVSGINHGPNLGDDVHYSGTVAAAREAAFYQIPALAVSLVSRDKDDYSNAGAFTSRLIREFHPWGWPGGTFLNVNIPGGSPVGYRVTRQGSKRIASHIEEKEDPRGRAYYWIGQDPSVWQVEAETDYQAISDGFVSVTPLQRDQTDYRSLRAFQDKSFSPTESS